LKARPSYDSPVGGSEGDPYEDDFEGASDDDNDKASEGETDIGEHLVKPDYPVLQPSSGLASRAATGVAATKTSREHHSQSSKILAME